MVQDKSHHDAYPATRSVPFRHEILRRYDALILALCRLFSFAPRFLRRFSASRNRGGLFLHMRPGSAFPLDSEEGA